MVCVIGISRGAGGGLVPVTEDVDGEVEDVVSRDNEERSGRTFGLGEGGRGEMTPRDPVLMDDVIVLFAEEILVAGVLLL
jgi:hypothetical protein